MSPPPSHDVVVVDTSLAIKWFLHEELSEDARDLLKSWEREGRRCYVPSWFAREVGNVLYRNALGGQIVLLDAQNILRRLLRTVTTLDFDPTTSARALDIAFQLRQQASYDSQYLALAEHLDCELWTADERFWRAAKPVFPQIRWVGEVRSGVVS